MSTHKAASIAEKGQPAKLVDVKTTSPSEGEILVKNHAWAINPVDYYIRDTGMFAQSWPMIVGEDTAGEVVEVGSGVQSHKKGDRVLLAPTYLLTGKSAEAGFQELTIGNPSAASKIPDSMKYSDAAVLPLGVSTAAAGLFQKDFLGLDLPSTSPSSNGKKVLIWGASSSVGSCAIQLAVAAGYEVVATASEKNFEHAKKLGASKVFDYNTSSIVGDITAELQNGTCAGAYDAISTNDTQLSIATILAQLGGGKMALTLPATDNIPATVEAKNVFAPTIFAPGNPVGSAVFQDFLPAALASGQFKPEPKAEVIGNGLGDIDAALNKHQAGVSAKKLVVTA